jgi:mannosyltransferase OCH1-like enzyme
MKLGNILNSDFFKHQRLNNDFHIKYTNQIKYADQKYWKWILKKYDFFSKSSLKKEIVPRIIHQIWLGSKIPTKYEIWRKSWMKHNPNYEYILWDEKKILDMELINKKQFVKAKNLGCKSDIARYEILYKFGGIYVDTDFEALKPIDPKFMTQSFIAGQLYDYRPQIGNGLIISVPKCSLLKALIDNLPKYSEVKTYSEIMSYAGPFYLTKIIFKNMFLKNVVILPSQYFYPWPSFMIHSERNRYSWATKKTFAMHHWEASWLKKSFISRLFDYIKKLLYKN